MRSNPFLAGITPCQYSPAKRLTFPSTMIQISFIALFTSLLRPHLSPIPSADFSIDNIIKPSLLNGASNYSLPASLPEGVVHSHNYPLISSSFVLKGEHQTVIRYLDGNRDKANLFGKESNTPQSNEVDCLFNLQNASLSVQRLIIDMSSESANQDVKCAVLASSTIYVSFCVFFWTDVNSIFVLRSSSPSAQNSSSITLAWCTMNNTVDHLTAIVEDMRKDIATDAFNFHMLGTTIADLKVVGTDGVCVSQTNHRSEITSFEGISTTVSEMQMMNVSSLPGEVKQASSLFSQRMVGCAMWGSNNHLSGTMLRDVNGGGSFLCSNSTFDWCHTTSSERPSLSSSPSPTIDSHSFSTTRSISSQTTSGNADREYVDETKDGVSRLTFTQSTITFTRCTFTNMKYSSNVTSEYSSGGSALFLTSSISYSDAALSLVSCTFSKCSVTHRYQVNGGCVFLYNLSTATNTVDGCSFDDWYPSNDANTNQFGGGIGTYSTSVPIVITNSNFTLSGEITNKNNGGFLAFSAKFTACSTTIANCRFIGDGKTTGRVISVDATSSYAIGSFSVTDSQILKTNSELRINTVPFESSSGFERTEITNTSIAYSNVLTNTNPTLVVDCKLDRCSISTSGQRTMLLFSGTSFTGKPATKSSSINLYMSSHVVFHKCEFTDCTPALSQSLIRSYYLPSLIVDTCSFTRCSGGKSVVDVDSSYSFFYFCTFTNGLGPLPVS
ncbi:hypothetical protein BLNAU_17381 [Blattamonas nauphoetae]|uniref:Uncharacterized protein n=1 Tax=Blattamonas nauphoetae TaxID=2049346 RepID=A0ABQ9XBS0_9EUKA|nr:hypothetical protein BLNAU_17381 [Blattamonas nauphoetae]